MSRPTPTPTLSFVSTPTPTFTTLRQPGSISDLENILFKKDGDDTDLFTFLVQIGVNMAIAVGVLMLFSYLRPRNKAVYARRQRWFSDNSKLPPEIPDDQPNETGIAVAGTANRPENVKAAKAKISGLKLKWIHFIFKIPDSLILEKLGLDSLIFIRTLALFVRAFIPIALISVFVLIPVDVIKGTKFVQANSSKITLKLASMENLQDDALLFMWVHTVAAWLFNFYVFWLIYVAYCDYIVLRQQYFTSPEYQHKISSRTLLALNLPKLLRRDEELDNLFRNKISAETSPPSCVAMGRRLTPLEGLIEEHEKTVRNLEKVLAKYLKKGVAGPKRPKMRVGGIFGKKEDAIEYWTCLIQNLETKIDRARENASRFKTTDFGFVSFTSVAQAHQTAAMLCSPKAMAAVMKSAHAEKVADGNVKGIRGNAPQVILAPEPRDMIWSNVSLTPQARKRRNYIGILLFIGLCASWFIPVAAILLFAQIRTIFALVPFLQKFADTHFALMSFLQVQIAPIVMAMFWLILPKVLQYISTFQAARTKTGLERAVFNKLFFFLVLTNLFMLTVMRTGTGFFFSIKKAVDNNENISFNDIQAHTRLMVQLFSSQMLATSNHFTAYISFRGFFANPLELAQAVALIVISFRRWLFASTPRQDREYTKPPPMNFGVQYSFHLFVFTVAFLFAPLTPLMPAIALIYFVISYHVYKYQSLYVNYTKIETGGRMWPMVYQRILSAQAIAQMAMGAVLYTQGAFVQAYTMLPLLLMTILMRIYGDYRLEPRTRFVAAAYPSGMFKLPRMFSGQFKDEAKTSIIAIRDFEYFDDSEAFSRAGLADRFMLPKLARPLMTPEVRKEVRHLLPQVFNGRLEDSSEKLKTPGQFVDSDSASIMSFETDSQATASHLHPNPPRNQKVNNRLSLYASQHIRETLSNRYDYYENQYDDDSNASSINNDPYARGRMDDGGSLYSVQPVDYARAQQMFAQPDHYRQERMPNSMPYDSESLYEYQMEQQRMVEMDLEEGEYFDGRQQYNANGPPFRSNSQQRGRQQY